jgi:hypothetical protein
VPSRPRGGGSSPSSPRRVDCRGGIQPGRAERVGGSECLRPPSSIDGPTVCFVIASVDSQAGRPSCAAPGWSPRHCTIQPPRYFGARDSSPMRRAGRRRGSALTRRLSSIESWCRVVRIVPGVDGDDLSTGGMGEYFQRDELHAHPREVGAGRGRLGAGSARGARLRREPWPLPGRSGLTRASSTRERSSSRARPSSSDTRTSASASAR